MPPPPPTFLHNQPGASSEQEAMASMLMSWYMSGYHTGYYQVQCYCIFFSKDFHEIFFFFEAMHELKDRQL